MCALALPDGRVVVWAGTKIFVSEDTKRMKEIITGLNQLYSPFIITDEGRILAIRFSGNSTREKASFAEYDVTGKLLASSALNLDNNKITHMEAR